MSTVKITVREPARDDACDLFTDDGAPCPVCGGTCYRFTLLADRLTGPGDCTARVQTFCFGCHRADGFWARVGAPADLMAADLSGQQRAARGVASEPLAPVYRLTATPGFLDAGDPGPPVFGIAALLRTAAPGEPTWVIGDPKATRRSAEDGGRTLRVPARFTFYAIRDDHGADCDCGCGGGSVVTFLLPEEY